ncbi:MAG: phosphonate monoester hydrolase [Rhodobacteraceae bacterium]|nr:MAG: phosphonate monoester hydrolase [Paracoccaceae bacterium]
MKNRNVLFIMADQLRWDYLSCYGHPHLKTPNIDWLASKGVKFNNAYVQSPFCGPSRMSTYTGRYCRSHGSTWNGFPLKVGERTIGDHLREENVRAVIIGKTHMKPDTEGMKWLGIEQNSTIGIHLSECGFEPFERDDGLHPKSPYDPNPPYNDFLRGKGYNVENPWDDHANSGLNDDGERLSGWLLKNSDLPADIEEQLSETPYMTQRAIDFMKHAGDQPWLCHLSYIKPHWPYIVPAPYHNMYSKEHILPAVRSEQEKETNHPVYGAYLKSRICQTFARDDVRERVIPAYMGLIKQIDDQLGVLFNWMKGAKLFDNTMIVFTSDHGDYLGDHWMGEKDLFHDQSVKVPLIIYDPRKEAKNFQGRESNHLVECIDLAPTFLDFFNIKEKPHILEGRGLKEILHSNEDPSDWREYAISEYDYSTRQARHIIGNKPDEAQLFMIRDSRWKYIFAEGFRPMLFDLEVDPKELHDLGESEQEIHLKAKKRLYDALFEWARKHHSRTTVTNEEIEKRTGKEPPGVIIGVWDEEEHQILFGENQKK